MDTRKRTNKPAVTSELEEILSGIGFSPENVIYAAAKHPVLFIKAIDYRRARLGERNAAEMLHKKTEAECSLRLRDEARKSDTKITEKGLETSVLLDEEVETAARQLMQAEEMDEYSRLLIEAYRMQRDCLKIVGELARNELSLQLAAEQEVGKMTAMREKVKTRFPASQE